MTRSEELFEKAVKLIPGGVNSPVRAFGSIGGCPRFIDHADGAYMYDVDGNKYLDFINSWGPMILGHNNPLIREAVIKACEKGLSYGAATEKEVEMAELITGIVPSIDMVRMVNSGTEAVMSAVRAARGYTGRNKIVKFMGCYHGHSDAMLVQAGSGVMTAGIPDSAGVPGGCTKDTLSAVYNDVDSVKTLFETFPEEIAAVIVEPVAANMGVVEPKREFLQGLRDLCTKYGAVLIFDEVITGFRLQLDGAQGLYGIQPDMTTFGKIIGAGMPVGAYGGKREIMSLISPAGPVYQAGTLSGNPVAMSAGLAQLNYLKDHPEVYTGLNAKSDWFFGEMKNILEECGKNYQINHVGSIGSLFFTETPVVNYATAKTSDTKAFAEYFKYMLENGCHFAPSQFEAIFLSAIQTKEELSGVLDMFHAYMMRK